MKKACAICVHVDVQPGILAREQDENSEDGQDKFVFVCGMLAEGVRTWNAVDGEWQSEETPVVIVESDFYCPKFKNRPKLKAR